jgi:hypothetical protein
MGKEELQTKETVRHTKGEGDIQGSPTRILEGGHDVNFNYAT